MATIDDLPKIEGLRDFFRGEIYGEVGDRLMDKGVLGDHSSPLFLEALSILDGAEDMVDLILNPEVSSEKKDEIIEATTQSLMQKLAALKAVLREEK